MACRASWRRTWISFLLGAQGTIGEIWVKGITSPSYWNKPGGHGTFWRNAGPPLGRYILMDPGCERETQIPLRGQRCSSWAVWTYDHYTGTNHYPEDIRSTVEESLVVEIAAISVPVVTQEKFGAMSKAQKSRRFRRRRWTNWCQNNVTAAISRSHGLNVADLIGPARSIPTTASGIRRPPV